MFPGNSRSAVALAAMSILALFGVRPAGALDPPQPGEMQGHGAQAVGGAAPANPTGTPSAPSATPLRESPGDARVLFRWSDNAPAPSEGYQLQVVARASQPLVYDSLAGSVQQGTVTLTPVYDATVGNALQQVVPCLQGQWHRARVRLAKNDESLSGWSPWSDWILAGSPVRDTHFISGTVRDRTTGAPLSDVAVSVFDNLEQRVVTSRTDSSGSYVTPDLPPAPPLSVGFVRTHNKLGLADETFCSSWFGEAWPTACTATGTIANGLTRIDFSLDRAAVSLAPGIDSPVVAGDRISGRVTDTAGRPGPEISVSFYPTTGGGRGDGVITTSSGEFSSKPLPPGTYYMDVNTRRGYAGRRDRVKLVPAGSQAPPMVNVALEEGGQISGTLRDTAGAQVPGVELFFCDASRSPEASVCDDESGSAVSVKFPTDGGFYTSDPLAPGTYYVQTSQVGGYGSQRFRGVDCPGASCPKASGSLVTVTAGSTTAGVDFTLTPLPQTASAGAPEAASAPTATPLHEAPGDTRILFSWANGDTAAADSELAGRDLDAVVRESQPVVYREPVGTVSEGNVAETPLWTHGFVQGVQQVVSGVEGRWHRGRVRAYGGGRTPSRWSPWSDWVFIGSPVPNARFFSGTVRDKSTGAPLADVAVSLFDLAGRRVITSRTDTRGSYVTPDLPPWLPIWFARTHNTLGYADATFCADPFRDTSCTATGVVGGSVTRIDFDLAHAAVSLKPGIDTAIVAGDRISGRVTDTAGRALPQASVLIRTENPATASRTITPSSGEFSSGPLAPGTYYIETDAWRGYAARRDRVELVPAGSQAPSTVAVALEQGGEISGTLRDVAGAPAALGHRLYFYDGSGSIVAETDTVSEGPAKGFYRSCALAPGTYYVQTANWNYFAQRYRGVECAGGSCAKTSGTPVNVRACSTTTDIDFFLTRRPQIERQTPR